MSPRDMNPTTTAGRRDHSACEQLVNNVGVELVKMKPPGIGGQVLVHVSIRFHFGYLFLTHSHVHHLEGWLPACSALLHGSQPELTAA